MHTQIELLAMLQTVDREIKQQTGFKQGLISELESKERAIQVKKREVEITTAAYAEREKLRAEKDRMFQDEGKKAVDKRMRMNRIKNIKELQALQREIDQTKQANGDLEDELIKIMQEIDTMKAQIQAKESEMDALQEELKQKQGELREQIGGIENDDGRIIGLSQRRLQRVRRYPGVGIGEERFEATRTEAQKPKRSGHRTVTVLVGEYTDVRSAAETPVLYVPTASTEQCVTCRS